MKVSDFMQREIFSITRDATLDGAMELMDTEGVRHLPVVDGLRVVGVISERDLLEVTGWLPKRMREVLEAPTGRVSEFMHSPVVTVSPQDSIVTASLRLVEWNIGCLPVLADAVLVGMVTESDVLGVYAAACRGISIAVDSDPSVEKVMTLDFVSANHRALAEEALEFCRSKHVRHLPLKDGDDLVGMISDRDLRLSLGRGQLEGTPVSELRSSELVTIPPDTKLSRAAEMLVSDRIGAIPVVENKRMVGMISTADVLNHCTQAFASIPGLPKA